MKESKRNWLDLRFLIGILFTFYGIILAVYGIVVHPTTNEGWNINFWWGLAMLVFGIVFLSLSRRQQKHDD